MTYQYLMVGMMGIHQKKRRIRNDSAVAGVIEALLLVALVTIILSTIQLIYIPEIMEQREVEHMDVVENQFSYLKSIIDLQSTLAVTVPISSPITLGTRELAYFVTARSYGQLDIIDDTNNKITWEGFPTGVPLTSIEYDAYNTYFIDQTFALEGGSLILQQSNGESILIEPSMSFENLSTQIKIELQLPKFQSIGGKNSTSGYKNCFIRTNYSSSTTYDVTTSYIHIYSEYLDAWNSTFHELLQIPIEQGYITVEKSPIVSPTHIAITPGTKTLAFDLTVSTIIAQIGPGTVVTS